MKYLYYFLLIISVISLACNRTKPTQQVSNKLDSLEVNDNRIVHSLNETLIPGAKKALEGWQEYLDVDEFILSFYNISKPEALNRASELSELVKLMRDSIRVEKLDRPNVIARFNVLYNETLRLADMANISSIKDEEVENEVSNILELFSAVNSKINTIYKVEEIQNSLEIDTETPIEIDENKKGKPEKYRNTNRRISSKKSK